MEFYHVLHQFTHKSPSERMMLIVTHGLIELMVNLLAEAKLKNGAKMVAERQNFSHAIKLLILNEAGVINDGLYGHLDYFRELRNSAAHSVFFQLAQSDFERIDRFLSDSGPVISEWSGMVRFNMFCSRTVDSLWNAHTDVFRNTLI